MTFSQALRQHARFRPHRLAIVEPGRSIDYRELDRRVDFSCHALRAKGITRGCLVGLSLQDRAEYLIVLLAMARLGAVVLPLDPRWTNAETQRVCDNFGATRVLCDRAERDAAWTALNDSDFGESATVYEDGDVNLDSPMLLSLSSGTTGLPKGPRVSQRKFINRFTVFWIDLGLCSLDRFVTATPLYFGGGRAFALAMIYAGGSSLLLCPPYKPEQLVAFINQQRATATFLVPTLLTRLLLLAREGELLLPTMRVLISSGAALYAAEQRDIRRKLSPNLFQYYSSTEGGGCSVLQPAAFEGHPDSVGQPCFGVEVEIVDDDHRPLPPGRIGRLRYRSAASADHYYKGDESAAFHDGFFYPGDLGEFDVDGFIYLRGRSKDMIIRGGVNIYPSDIEAVVLQHPSVIEASVVGVPSKEFGEDLAVAAVTRGTLDVEALRAHCASVLARYKVPRYFLQFDELPKAGVGKIDKKAVAALVAEKISVNEQCRR
jgi:acyl-CoA synthetase (AMP-forming)/AMP-acid ligase II